MNARSPLFSFPDSPDDERAQNDGIYPPPPFSLHKRACTLRVTFVLRSVFQISQASSPSTNHAQSAITQSVAFFLLLFSSSFFLSSVPSRQRRRHIYRSLFFFSFSLLFLFFLFAFDDVPSWLPEPNPCHPRTMFFAHTESSALGLVGVSVDGRSPSLQLAWE